MAAFEWGTHGVVTTEESTLLPHDGQQLWEIWSVVVHDSGVIAPARLGDALAVDFAEAVKDWAESVDLSDFVDPLTLSYNGLPLVKSRSEAVELANQYRNAARPGH